MSEFEEEVKYHTKLKHEFIKTYLNFYTDNVVRRTHERKGKLPHLGIFDLYAAKGWVHCNDGGLLNSDEEKWEGSALLSAKCIGEYPASTCLFLNTYNDDVDECKIQKNALKMSLAEYCKKYPGLSQKTILKTLPVEEAVSEASKYLDPNYPSIWILDPYDPKQLPWEIIESIAQLKGKYPSKKGIETHRMPELIINFMSSYLQRFSDTHPEMATIAIGMPESEWRPKLKEYIQQYQNVREAVLRLYFDRLSEIYGRDPVFILVRDTTNRAVIYCMLLCSSHQAGYYLMLKEGLPKLKKYEVEIWKRNAERILFKKDHPDQSSIDQFF